MTEHYQIQEIVAQDESGVLFRALDTDNDRMVGLHRFFPFGRDGGGLDANEREEYGRGVAEVTRLRLPELRAVLDGGCDPVDGLPYLVTEWAAGEPLSDLLAEAEFDSHAAAGLLDRILELCERISQILGGEALWVETVPEMIVRTGDDRNCGFSFGFSPVRWLVNTRNRRSLLPLVELAENLMGWRGHRMSEQAGGGLGGFLKWLRGNAETASLRETRLQLAHRLGREAPAAVSPPVAPASAASPPHAEQAPRPERAATPAAMDRPAASQPEIAAASPPSEPDHILRTLGRSRRNPWRWVAVLVVAIGVVGWWVIKHPDNGRNAASGAAPPQTAEEKRLAEIEELAAKLVLTGGGESTNTVFKAEDRQAVLNEAGKRITVEGVVERVKASASGKTFYLEFAGCAANGTRGRVVVKDAGPGLAEADLRKWLGQRVRVTGEVKPTKGRPEISIADGKAIEKAS